MEKEITVDEIVKKLQSGMSENPDELSRYLIVLSAKLFQASSLETKAEIEYVKKWQELKQPEDSDKKTDMLAKGTDEYIKWRGAVATGRTMLEMIRAIKKRLTLLSGEYQSN